MEVLKCLFEDRKGILHGTLPPSPNFNSIWLHRNSIRSKGFPRFQRMDVIKSQQLSVRSIEKVVVHPLVLLSIVDNYYRVAKDTRKRVVGVLLGSSFKGTVDVTNSYSVPFEEDDKDPSIWFLDHNYHEAMFSMFKRINAKEHVVGWYSTGPKLRENDLDVHGLFNDYIPNPVLVIIDVQPKELGIPTKAYYAIEEVKENATQKSQKVFVHVPSEIAAHEVEEIGVEHLLRDVKDTTISTLATEVTGKLAALKGLDARLKEIRGYLDLVIDEKLPLNHEILYHLQDVFNLLPNLNVADLIKAFAVKTNDQMLVIYLSSLIRSVIALHNLISNKMLNKEHEKAEDAKPATVPPVSGSEVNNTYNTLSKVEATKNSTMELLSFSAPSSSCYPSSNLPQFPPTKPRQSFSLRPLPPPPPQQSVKCSFHSSPQTLEFDSKPNFAFSASSPQTPATAMRGSESDAMGLLLRERIVFLGTQIDDFVADAIISQLLLLDAQDPTKDIRLFINSTGGSLSSSMAIYDVLKLVRADVSTIALGISASTASIVLGGGTKGKRLAMANTRIMIHQPLGGASGQAIDVEIQAREMMHNKENVTRIIAESTGRDYEQVQKDIDRDRYMSPIEAVEYGIIDGVIDEDAIIPLEPVPDRVKPTLSYDAISKDLEKFLNPDIPDEEII
ncbi:hypothetical protein SSX86_004392 [Deinandra increscens subsp. villosa]|uniref:Endopeptidase Clp n=3 Tax=Magnoliopsida TaxID=3398 RepID=A0AAP0DRV0_9ASTR